MHSSFTIRRCGNAHLLVSTVNTTELYFAQQEKPHWGAGPRIDLGLPYSKLAHCQLSYVAPMYMTSSLGEDENKLYTVLI
jgi:hypothetical protein